MKTVLTRLNIDARRGLAGPADGDSSDARLIVQSTSAGASGNLVSVDPGNTSWPANFVITLDVTIN